MSSIRSSQKLSLAISSVLASFCYAGSTLAEESAAVEEIVVTGTFIRGGSEQGALPVSVISSEELEKQGSPSMLDIVKAIPAVQGVAGDANQFGAGYSLGSANVNLRGLGPLRTLVLLNGRRIAPNPAVGIGVDVNLLPMAAIGRIEVLKDGAAATYGSDALSGVVNFITKTDVEGFFGDANYSYIEDSDGEYSANLGYGWKGDTTDVLVTAGYRHRSELSAKDRDWSLRAYSTNPSGGWTASGNPGTYRAGPAVGGTTFVDPQCQNLGGVPTATVGGITSTPLPSMVGATGCQTQYLALDNIIEDEDHYQVFAQVNQRLGDSMKLHFEGLYAEHDAIEHSSPSYAPTQGPSGISAAGVNSVYTVPVGNPGFTGLLPQLTPAQAAAVQTGGGVTITAFRPFLVGGNPLTGGAKEDIRDFDSYRFSLGLSGDLGTRMGWDTAVTYGKTTNDAHTPDILVARLQRALSGFGGPNCTGNVAGANGCLWLNPFSTSISQNVITGQQSSVPASAPNSAEVTRWIFGDFGYEIAQSVLAIDAGLNGELGINLPGGEIAWAAGMQYRENGYERDPVDQTDPGKFPCPLSSVDPTATCPVSSGPLSFNSPLTPYDITQDVRSAYAEIRLPILDSLDATVAVRYEDYGGGIGDTTDPKLALHWQVMDGLAFRGSVGTTFRAPPGTQTQPGLLNTGNAFVTQAGRYLPFDTFGNPDLKPESAFTYNIGALFNVAGFSGSIDYWRFEIEDAIVNDSGGDIVRAFFTGSHCGDPAFAGLQGRLTFNSGVCGPVSDLGRVRITSSNAQTFDLNGIDAELRYTFDNVLGGRLILGGDGSYTLKYQIGAVNLEGVQLQPSGDYIGTRASAGGSLPQWKASLFIDYNIGNSNIRWTARHVSDMFDIRSNTNLTAFAGFRAGDAGSTVDAVTLHDLTFRQVLPADTVVSASVTNVFDKDPALARLDLSYDPFVGSPVGRIFKVGVSKAFK